MRTEQTMFQLVTSSMELKGKGGWQKDERVWAEDGGLNPSHGENK